MKFSIVIPNTGELANIDAILKIAEKAENLGFVTLWTADHLVLPVKNNTSSPYSKGHPDPSLRILDPMIVLAAVAAKTKRIGLGVSVYLPALRHPIIAAKLIASLDQLSQGRLTLGVGAGWIPEEYDTMGVNFADRGKVLDEHLSAMRTLFEQPRPCFSGEFYQFDNMGFEPKPVQSPFPIWIGGNSAPARRRVAAHGDGWHVIDVPAAKLKHGITDLRARLEQNGRDPMSVTISSRSRLLINSKKTAQLPVETPMVGSISAILDELQALSDIGVSQVALWPGVIENLDLNGYLERMEQFSEEILKPFANH